MTGTAGRAHHAEPFPFRCRKNAAVFAVFAHRAFIDAAFNKVQVESRTMQEIVGFPDVIGIGKTAEFFGFSRETAYRLATSSRIVTIKIGRSCFIVTESIHHHIQRSITFRQKTIGTSVVDTRS
ncbi:MerR family transcriptional regulator [Acetobacter fallax]|uniref:Helix-turn-helix domain-containing protein n=1 Tax=Acetobacter fallax TaxID=1737473 RepID=A0ABX0KJ46_9PROT|nr:hypothetical protein [Acetobacter fallax]NHO34395.1 hypothetical protein [Acetobacter fallax]NHO37964.1 hypothetical protein [Acetobacter fallax]